MLHCDWLESIGSGLIFICRLVSCLEGLTYNPRLSPSSPSCPRPFRSQELDCEGCCGLSPTALARGSVPPFIYRCGPSPPFTICSLIVTLKDHITSRPRLVLPRPYSITTSCSSDDTPLRAQGSSRARQRCKAFHSQRSRSLAPPALPQEPTCGGHRLPSWCPHRPGPTQPVDSLPSP